jgi:hypothetical protein
MIAQHKKGKRGKLTSILNGTDQKAIIGSNVNPVKGARLRGNGRFTDPAEARKEHHLLPRTSHSTISRPSGHRAACVL